MNKLCMANVVLDRELLLEFFLTFARFEYALKSAGFVNGNIREAKPNWSRFGISVDIGMARLDPNCAAAVDYLGLHPPWRQVLTSNGQVGTRP